MKTRCLHPVLTLASICSLACAADGPGLTARFVDADAPEHAAVRTLGENAINRLAFSLVNEVRVAMSKGGAEKAVDQCHLKALPLTGEIIKGQARITAVKRTSLKLRNPANAPDAAETLALEKVERGIENGVLPKVLLQQVDLPGGKSEWRVYRPVGVSPECMACHGPQESMSPELQKILKERYPSDQATGYGAGQWRGLIRVSVGDAPPPPPPPQAPTPTKK
jgi:hypothetical protein